MACYWSLIFLLIHGVGVVTHAYKEPKTFNYDQGEYMCYSLYLEPCINLLYLEPFNVFYLSFLFWESHFF